jgi:hypothetical protein
MGGMRGALNTRCTLARSRALTVEPIVMACAPCPHLDFRLAVLVVCVQLGLVATSSRLLFTPGETLGSVARGAVMREAARGAPQVAISPCPLLTPTPVWACSNVRRRRHFALLL